MWHTLLITAHGAAGGIALVAGCVAIAGRRLFRTYLAALGVMELALALAVASTWTGLGTGPRVLFGAFAALGAVMVWRGERARRLLPQAGTSPSPAYVEHVGFTLVSLADAFVVVLLLDLGTPAWVVAAAGVGIAVAGHVTIRTARTRLARTSAPRAGARAGASRADRSSWAKPRSES